MPIFASLPSFQRPMPGSLIDPTNSFANSLSACFKFDEASGAPRELLSQTLVTLGGTTSWGASAYPTIGPCWNGDGSTGYGQINLPRLDSWTKFTVAFLWMCPAAGSSTTCRIMEKGSDTDWNFIEDPGTGHAIKFFVGNTGGPNSAPFLPYDGKWHLITGTYDGTNCGMFIDGKPSAQNYQTISGKTGTVSSLTFFRHGGASSTFFSASQLGGFWFWNGRVFTPAEVIAHYLSPWQMFLSPGQSFVWTSTLIPAANPAALLPAM